MDTKYHTHNIPILCGFCILLLLNFFAPRAYAQDSAYAEGEKMFRTNQPEKAIPLLQKALLEKKAAPSVYNYLGTTYQHWFFQYKQGGLRSRCPSFPCSAYQDHLSTVQCGSCP